MLKCAIPNGAVEGRIGMGPGRSRRFGSSDGRAAGRWYRAHLWCAKASRIIERPDLQRIAGSDFPRNGALKITGIAGLARGA